MKKPAANHPFRKFEDARYKLTQAKKLGRRLAQNRAARERYDELTKLDKRVKYRMAHGIPIEAPLMKNQYK